MAGPTKSTPSHNGYLLSPPMQAMKDLWDDYRAKRRERKATTGKNKTNDTTPASETQARSTTPTSSAGEPSLAGDAQAYAVSETNGPDGPQEMLEMNPEAMKEPPE